MGKMALFVLHCFKDQPIFTPAEASDPRLLQECQSQGLDGWPGEMKPENLCPFYIVTNNDVFIPDMKVLEKAMDGGREREGERDESRWIVYIYIYIYVYMWGVVAVPHEDMMKQGL